MLIKGCFLHSIITHPQAWCEVEAELQAWINGRNAALWRAPWLSDLQVEYEEECGQLLWLLN